MIWKYWWIQSSVKIAVKMSLHGYNTITHLSQGSPSIIYFLISVTCKYQLIFQHGLLANKFQQQKTINPISCHILMVPGSILRNFGIWRAVICGNMWVLPSKNAFSTHMHMLGLIAQWLCWTHWRQHEKTTAAYKRLAWHGKATDGIATGLVPLRY